MAAVSASATVEAAAGGGGRGMRIVRTEDELAPAMRAAATEAAAAFKNGNIYVEKYDENPRHIESSLNLEMPINQGEIGFRDSF